MNTYIKTPEGNRQIISNRKGSIILSKGIKIFTSNIEGSKEELSRDVYVIKGTLKETEYGLVVE